MYRDPTSCLGSLVPVWAAAEIELGPWCWSMAELPDPCTAGGHIRHGQRWCWTGLTFGVTINTQGMLHLYDCVYPNCFASSSGLGFHALLAHRRPVTQRSTL